MYIRDTIAAISTPSGNGGIGIVRVSGAASEAIADTIFISKQNGGLKSHRFYFGTIFDPASGDVVDEAMAVLMKAPNSYTREDVLELHCHGGMLVVEQVLALVLAAGARSADPGEFTRRAFLNGRIDLLQAEAVIDIINSQTEAALKVAQRQRTGILSKRIEDARQHIVHALAMTEAYIDFPEDDLGSDDRMSIVSSIEAAESLIASLIAGYDDGCVLREGISVLIIGKPNAGKSSLLNRLLNENRAIVTHLPGTTRDIIEETINISGLPVRLLDTAGIRQTDDIIEQEGISRAFDKIELADLVLFVLDGSRPFEKEDHLIMDSLSHSRIIALLNKSDLPLKLEFPNDLAGVKKLSISAESGSGIEQLKVMIKDTFLREINIDSREFVTISRARHRDALVAAEAFLRRVLTAIKSELGLELIAVDLRDALSSIGSVTGETTSDELLDIIFSSFCIGK